MPIIQKILEVSCILIDDPCHANERRIISISEPTDENVNVSCL